MKKIIAFAGLFMSLTSIAQTVTGGAGSTFSFVPYNFSRIHASDSVEVSATAITNQSVAGISWIQTSGPIVKIVPTFTWQTGIAGYSNFWLQGLTPGGYGFTATIQLTSGQSYSTKDSLIVVADPVCPPARTVTGIQILINGQLTAILLPGTKIQYSDGTVQQY